MKNEKSKIGIKTFIKIMMTTHGYTFQLLSKLIQN